MKAVVLYDTAYGNTRTIAESVASKLGSGAAAVQVDGFDPGILHPGDLLVVGSPINGWKPTARIAESLADLGRRGLAGVKAAAFDTRVKLFIHGDAAKKMTKALTEAGATIVAEPMAFYVKGSEGPLLEGEEERAAAWAADLVASVQRQA
ncbi:flavodoxin family protein [Pseudarthrobacter sp. Fe7]|nr:flavodoxin family protein [Pseudarthrobacter sp. Fe7]